MAILKVDSQNRDNLRRLHTVTHVLNAVLRNKYGTHVWQNGSNIKEEYGTLDVTHYKMLESLEVFDVEKSVNQIIFKGLNVIVEVKDRGIAEQEHGFILYQGGAVPMKDLRLVSIDNLDVQACGGLHVDNTREIGLFKIVDVVKVQDGVLRFKYVVADFALDFISNKQKIIEKISEVFSVSEESLIASSEKFFLEWKHQKKVIDKLYDELIEMHSININNSEKDIFEINFAYDMSFMMKLAEKIVKDKFKVSCNNIIITNNMIVDKYSKIIDKGKYKIYII